MEVPQEILDALADWFVQSLSSYAAARRAAEQSISSTASSPGFALALLGLAASPRHDLQVRLAASVHFRNLLRRRWPKPDADDATNHLPASDCAIIKAHLLQLLLTAPPIIQAPLSEALAAAAASDFPARFMLVKLAEIRKEVQCPICLGTWTMRGEDCLSMLAVKAKERRRSSHQGSCCRQGRLE